MWHGRGARGGCAFERRRVLASLSLSLSLSVFSQGAWFLRISSQCAFPQSAVSRSLVLTLLRLAHTHTHTWKRARALHRHRSERTDLPCAYSGTSARHTCPAPPAKSGSQVRPRRPDERAPAADGWTMRPDTTSLRAHARRPQRPSWQTRHRTCLRPPCSCMSGQGRSRRCGPPRAMLTKALCKSSSRTATVR